MIGFHFLSDDGRLRTGWLAPPDGEWLEVEGEIEICTKGLHGSKLIPHALRYAPGLMLTYCQFEGIEDYQDDKFVARKRKILKRWNIRQALREMLENDLRQRECLADILKHDIDEQRYRIVEKMSSLSAVRDPTIEMRVDRLTMRLYLDVIDLKEEGDRLTHIKLKTIVNDLVAVNTIISERKGDKLHDLLDRRTPSLDNENIKMHKAILEKIGQPFLGQD